ncbi:Imm49 family immunity protein [Corallococcus sp. BB11-1]|uniref:Imm49 family immunity protein n=1 Tax=Corallococcus sp. BB11-1 TaxID=2996783 RepID=UPI00226E080E|nr:Imm49 family immunity protein [Corallococcus sp. BB11-1]MCY1034029.1 Imm49 family immunity protein [Corallococcus sp. BB11-1]
MTLPSEFLPVFVHNALGDAAELLPAVRAGTISWRKMMEFCQHLRLAGIGSLFLEGTSEGLLLRLFQSGRAFGHYLTHAVDAPIRTSQCAPFFDAVAADDVEGATLVARHARRAWVQGEEYAEDFYFVELLMQHFFLGAEPHQCEGLLARYEQALKGAEDARWGICKALLESDGKAFGESLSLFLSERADHFQRQVRKDRLAPELAVTVAHFCVEGLALVRLAERKGLPTEEDYLHVPSIAREPLPSTARADSWLQLDP